MSTGAQARGSSARRCKRMVPGKPANLHLFLTHFHWDHIQGLPFFHPLYSKENSVTFYSMKSPEETRDILEGQMDVPYFPVDFRFLPAQRNFVGVNGQTFRFGDIEVKNFPLHHPQGCHGYCFSHRRPQAGLRQRSGTWRHHARTTCC